MVGVLLQCEVAMALFTVTSLNNIVRYIASYAVVPLKSLELFYRLY